MTLNQFNGMAVKLTQLLKNTDVITVENTGKEKTLEEMVNKLCQLNQFADKNNLLKCVMDRERLRTTNLGDGFAVPHGQCKNVTKSMLLLGISQEGVEWECFNHAKAHIILLSISPEHNAERLAVLARSVKVFSQTSVKQLLSFDLKGIYDKLAEIDKL